MSVYKRFVYDIKWIFFFHFLEDNSVAKPRRKRSPTGSPSSSSSSSKKDSIKFKTLEDVKKMSTFDSSMNITQFAATNKKTTKIMTGILELDQNNCIVLNQTIKGNERETIVSRINKIIHGEDVRMTTVDNVLFSTTFHNESTAIVVKITFHRKAIVHKGTQLVKIIIPASVE